MEHTCLECGQQFAGRKRKYCSEHCCRTVQIRKQNAKRKADGYTYRKQHSLCCDQCGQQFFGRTQSARYCSRTCGAKASLPLAQANAPRPKPQPPTLVQCEWCNALHPAKRRKRYCSAACMQQAMTEHAKPKRSALRVAIEDGDHDAVIDQVRLRSTTTPNGCWEWNGQLVDGYPYWRLGKSGRYQVHRLVLEAKHRAPLGSQAAHHMCANSKCVNPDHLQPVTHRENLAEMLARKSYLARICELEDALRAIAPNHPLLRHIEVA